MIYESVLDTIGHTPVVHLEKIAGNDIYVKLEMFNPGMSIKDRIAYEMITALIKEGKLGKPGQKAVEGTSGNTGIGLALVCANKGIPLTIVMPENMKVKRYVLREALKNGKDDFTSFEEKREGVSLEGFDPAEVKDVLAKVRSIFSKTLLLPEFKIGDTAIWTTDLGGDSMSYVAMVNDLNTAFQVDIPTEKYGKLTCVKDFAGEILSLRHQPKKGSEQQK